MKGALARLGRRLGWATHGALHAGGTPAAAREDERRRLGRDLHDGPASALAATVLRLDAAADVLDRDPAAARRLLAGARADTQDALTDLRLIVGGLRPAALDERGLAGAIEDQARRLSRDGTLEVDVTCPRQVPALPAEIEIATYRIAQEAMANVSRHAGARHCAVALHVDGAVELTVRDDGRGPAPRAAAGLGLTTMSERAGELGGTVGVQALPGGGTLMRAVIPVASRPQRPWTGHRSAS